MQKKLKSYVLANAITRVKRLKKTRYKFTLLHESHLVLTALSTRVVTYTTIN